MRFFEPRWLEPLLSSLDETELLQFMGPLTDMAWRNELAGAIWRIPGRTRRLRFRSPAGST